MHPLNEFKRRMAMIQPDEILRTGAKPWPGSWQTDHWRHVPSARWVGTDIAPGDGVDIIGDLQRLHELTTRTFDGIYSVSTLEHVERPWLAIHAMAQLLKTGGAIYLHSHQTFPLHGYPRDYFRFSIDALSMMCSDSGLFVVAAEYGAACTITPPPDMAVWDDVAESYLDVMVCAIK